MRYHFFSLSSTGFELPGTASSLSDVNRVDERGQPIFGAKNQKLGDTKRAYFPFS